MDKVHIENCKVEDLIPEDGPGSTPGTGGIVKKNYGERIGIGETIVDLPTIEKNLYIC